MMETNSTLVENSRYVVGGKTEVNSKRIEWWERTTFLTDESDILYVINQDTAGRLDKLAHAFYDDTALWWFIAQYNAVLDPFDEVTPGRVLRVPTKERMQTMLDGKQGGYESTREVPLSNITPII